MIAPVRITHTDVDTYLALERESEVRHEYVDGELFAMTGASRAHNALTVALTVRMGAHLAGGPCRLAVADMKVRPTGSNRFYYPDLVVSCNDPVDEPDDFVETRPTLVIEVLSPSTEAIDRREKRLAYQSIPSLEEYVLVAQEMPMMEVYRRAGEDWLLSSHGAGERLALASIGLELDIDELYRNVR